MALDTYSNLKKSIQDWSHRNDVSSRIDDFILITEQEMYNNSIESLEVREQEISTQTDTVVGLDYIALPDGYKSMRAILLDDKTTDAQQYQLTYTTPELLRRFSVNGCPSQFTITDKVQFNRPVDAVYNIEIQHIAKIQALTEDNPTNSILTDYPAIYLSGCLWALYEWAKDGESAAASYSRFINAIKGANLATKNGKYGPAPAMRSEGWVV